MPQVYSIFEYFGGDEGHGCGYCKGKKTNKSHGMWGHALRHQDYQTLIDRGWRRSGNYLYKPTMDKTCCPQYTIRCDVGDFKPTKSHKKTIKRFRNYIITGKRPGKEEEKMEEGGEKEGNEERDRQEEAQARLKFGDQDMQESKKDSSDEDSDNEDDKPSTSAQTNPLPPTPPPQTKRKSPKPFKSGTGADPSKPQARKAKDLRRERALAKGKAAAAPKKAGNAEKTLEDFTDAPWPEDCAHTFSVKTVLANTDDPEFKTTYAETLTVYQKYQVAVHGDRLSKCTSSQFSRFLCDSSMEPEPWKEEDAAAVHPRGYGAFHQLYLLDGKIVAVGVVDVLAGCLSSVYLFYDPAFAFLSFGTVSSLFEIAFTRKLARVRPSLKYYYMGFYIHTCPKMRYKAQYSGSNLLCPETYNWVDVNKAKELLDKSRYARLYGDEFHRRELSIQEVKILYKRRVMNYFLYTMNRNLRTRENPITEDEEEAEVREYARLVGEKVTNNALLFRES